MITTINPATEQPIQDYTPLSSLELEERLQRAHHAYQQWKHNTLRHRADLLHHIATLLLQNKQQYAELITTEMGKPITAAIAEVQKCALVCQYYADQGPAFLADQPVATDTKSSYITYRPTGPILAIMPWNYPFWQVFRFAAPNLMAGNVVLLKHAPNCSGCGQAIATLFAKAGLPSGVFQSLIIEVDQVEYIIAHPNVSGVTLTGSQRAGRAVGALAGQHLKPCVLELGGSDPYLVLEDADLDLAASLLTQSRLNNSGQVCIAAKRIIAIESIYERLKDNILRASQEYTLGDPMDPNTRLGPLARNDLRTTVHQQLQNCLEQGATLLMGGTLPDRTGYYYPATVLEAIRPGMPAYNQEIFGPVIALFPAKDEADAIALANSTGFGLGAGIFTRNHVHGDHIAKQHLQAGACTINSCVSSDPRLPFGGIKGSGFGRELGIAGIRAFLNTKTVSVPHLTV